MGKAKEVSNEIKKFNYKSCGKKCLTERFLNFTIFSKPGISDQEILSV